MLVRVSYFSAAIRYLYVPSARNGADVHVAIAGSFGYHGVRTELVSGLGAQCAIYEDHLVL